MSAQSVAPRSRSPQQPDSDDAVMLRAMQLTAWARTNIRIIIVGAVLIAAVVGGLLWYRTQQANRRAEAGVAFLQLEQAVAAGNPELATRELERFVAQFGGTVAADEARLMLARVHLQAGQPAQAVTAVEPLASDPGASQLAAQAALLLAAAQQSAGETQQAVDAYLRVADQAPLQFQRIEALSSAALLRLQTGDAAGAAELYRRAVELTEEESAERAVFEMRLAEAEAEAGVR